MSKNKDMTFKQTIAFRYGSRQCKGEIVLKYFSVNGSYKRMVTNEIKLKFISCYQIRSFTSVKAYFLIHIQ